MSKKLIAVAAAAALALTGLVGVSTATALPVQKDVAVVGTSYVLVTGTTGRTGSGTAADPFVVAMPHSGTVEAGEEISEFIVSSSLARKAANITATEGIKLLDEPGDADNKYTAASGASSLSLTTTATGTLEFYAFATSTKTGIVTVNIDGDITQVYMKGLAGAAYAIKSVTPPATAVQVDGKGTYVVEVVDAFGNAANVSATGTASVTGGGTGTAVKAEDGTANVLKYSATTKRYAVVVTAGASSGQIAVGINLTVTPTDDQKAAFGTPVLTYFNILNTSSLAEQVASLTTQVAALQVIVDRKVTKKRYNTLARKWNAAFPSQKVWVKP
jgi:hypothetical protein